MTASPSTNVLDGLARQLAQPAREPAGRAGRPIGRARPVPGAEASATRPGRAATAATVAPPTSDSGPTATNTTEQETANKCST